VVLLPGLVFWAHTVGEALCRGLDAVEQRDGMTAATAGAPVVVGVDGSQQGLAAVEQAVRIAVARNRPVRLVHAFTWPLAYPAPATPLGPVPMPPDPYGVPDAAARQAADRVVTEAEAHARRCDARVRATAVVVDGSAAAVLIGESGHADLLVVGHRGVGGFAGLLLGSVAVQVAAHATCPVLVVRGAARGTGPVVVGVDGSPTSADAISFAAGEAAWRQAPLLAVHTWAAPVSTGPGDMLPLVYDVDRVAAEERRVLAESVAGLAETHPDVRLEQRLVEGRAPGVLTELSGHAQLLVVGARGHGGFTGLLLGSVSRALIYHADCPVAVVRPTPS
jgi:nucleotide-binding universal stress UspA family protein